jgi:hypothetical protein
LSDTKASRGSGITHGVLTRTHILMIKYFYDNIWKKSNGGYAPHSPNRERVKSKVGPALF